jgi:hypothetical protein
MPTVMQPQVSVTNHDFSLSEKIYLFNEIKYEHKV